MEALRMAQKKLLSVTRDRTFLLDRLMLHEKMDNSTSESEETDSSDDGEPVKIEPTKKYRILDFFIKKLTKMFFLQEKSRELF